MICRDVAAPKISAVADLAGKAIVPPLPSVVIELLRSTSLCFLATSTVDHSEEEKGEPHLSLMRFTHCASVDVAGEDVVILSTRRDTKKFAMLTANPNVAILVHDFDSRKSELAGATGGKYTITLNGEARVETTLVTIRGGFFFSLPLSPFLFLGRSYAHWCSALRPAPFGYIHIC